ncbi:1-phosphofructokinase family hexose kinase [Diaminobutyricibacter sp. McL0618]|uniref:1-phosphofructokinase family hexose kinase n=1 Tax=Leifsonia sp. McL0618 TaxID=3415677 RepID=UPI003CF28B84
MIRALALSPSLDITHEVDSLTRGGITRPTRSVRVAGGKTLNAARVAHSLGARVHVFAALGGPTGQWITDSLAAEGIPVTTTTLHEPTRTCIAIVETARQSPVSTDLYEPAATLAPNEWTAFRTAVQAARGDGGWATLSGSIPAGVPLDELGQLLAALRSAGSKIALDSSGDGLRTLVGLADVVKINLQEATELLEETPGDAAHACRLLRDRYRVDAVVTDGIRGAAALVGEEEHDVPGPRQLGRFPAGSGDAFLGGLITGLDRGDGLVAALTLAADVGQRNALVAGQGRLA